MSDSLTTKQACAMLNVSRNTLAKLAKNGRIKRVVISSTCNRYSRESLEKFIRGEPQ